MSEHFSEALMLMGVGLATVFVVLLLVIGFGNLLINVVNKIAPEEEKKAAPATAAKAAAVAAVDPQVQQAIAKAVDQITAGKGQVVKIERI